MEIKGTLEHRNSYMCNVIPCQISKKSKQGKTHRYILYGLVEEIIRKEI